MESLVEKLQAYYVQNANAETPLSYEDMLQKMEHKQTEELFRASRSEDSLVEQLLERSEKELYMLLQHACTRLSWSVYHARGMERRSNSKYVFSLFAAALSVLQKEASYQSLYAWMFQEFELPPLPLQCDEEGALDKDELLQLLFFFLPLGYCMKANFPSGDRRRYVVCFSPLKHLQNENAKKMWEPLHSCFLPRVRCVNYSALLVSDVAAVSRYLNEGVKKGEIIGDMNSTSVSSITEESFENRQHAWLKRVVDEFSDSEEEQEEEEEEEESKSPETPAPAPADLQTDLERIQKRMQAIKDKLSSSKQKFKAHKDRQIERLKKLSRLSKETRKKLREQAVEEEVKRLQDERKKAEEERDNLKKLQLQVEKKRKRVQEEKQEVDTKRACLQSDRESLEREKKELTKKTQADLAAVRKQKQEVEAEVEQLKKRKLETDEQVESLKRLKSELEAQKQEFEKKEKEQEVWRDFQAKHFANLERDLKKREADVAAAEQKNRARQQQASPAPVSENSPKTKAVINRLPVLQKTSEQMKKQKEEEEEKRRNQKRREEAERRRKMSQKCEDDRKSNQELNGFIHEMNSSPGTLQPYDVSRLNPKYASRIISQLKDMNVPITYAPPPPTPEPAKEKEEEEEEEVLEVEYFSPAPPPDSPEKASQSDTSPVSDVEDYQAFVPNTNSIEILKYCGELPPDRASSPPLDMNAETMKSNEPFEFFDISSMGDFLKGLVLPSDAALFGLESVFPASQTASF